MGNINLGPASSSTANQTAQLTYPASSSINAGVFAQAAVPFIVAPSGSMGTNGVITLGTALPVIYPNSYVYLPAAAVSPGAPAGWYFTQFSSTTVGIVYSNQYAPFGSVQVPSLALITPVPAGTGPYTGVTTLVTGPQFTVLGNTLGVGGSIRTYAMWGVPGNTNSKIIALNFGGNAIVSTTITAATTLSYRSFNSVFNCGTLVNQVVNALGSLGAGIQSQQVFSVNTALAQTLAFVFTMATATDYMVLDAFNISIIPTN